MGCDSYLGSFCYSPVYFLSRIYLYSVYYYYRGRVGDFFIFRMLKYILFFVNGISLSIFQRRYINNIGFLLLNFSLQGQWMDSMCRLGSSGNSPSALGRSDLGRAVGPSYSLGLRDFIFLLYPLYCFPCSRLPSNLLLFLWLISFLQFPCASV